MAAAAAMAGPSSSQTSTPRLSKDKKSKSSKKHKSSSSSRRHDDSTVVDIAPSTAASESVTGGLSDDGVMESAFETMYPVLNLSIPPVWTPDPYAAFSDLMDTLVMRYVPQLSGVLITHRPIRFMTDSAKFYADNASASAPVQFECIVWRPKIGQKLEGTITLSSPSHVSLLLYGTFNASIPASHLSNDSWEFVIDAEADLHVHAMGADRGLGHWRSKTDASRLGGEDGKLSFIVISMTVANHILSLHGSMLEDPFSVPAPTTDASYLAKSLSDTKVLGFAATGNKAREARERKDNDHDDTHREETKTHNRRVRWEDESDQGTPVVAQTDNDGEVDEEDDAASTNDDGGEVISTPTIIKEQGKAKGSKRKSKKSLDQELEALVDEEGAAKSREKKKRKKERD